MGMAQGGAGAGRQGGEIDAEIGQREYLAQPAFGPSRYAPAARILAWFLAWPAGDRVVHSGHL